MAGAGYKLFNTGDVLTAAQVNTYLQEQVVMVFANSTARTTALSGVLAEGMVSYLKDTDALEIYSGSAWVGYGSGDITGVTAGTGISGGGTSGTVTITNSMATEITAAGDIIVGTGSGTFDNLPIGTTGQVLTADTTVSPYKVKWAAAGSSGALTLVKTDSFSAASAVAVDSVFTSTYTNYLLQIDFDQGSAYETNFRWRAGGSDKTASNYKLSVIRTNSTGGSTVDNTTIAYIPIVYQGSTGQKMVSMEIFAPQASGRKTNIIGFGYAPSTPSMATYASLYDVAESHDGFKLYVDGGTITGNYWLYGYQKS